MIMIKLDIRVYPSENLKTMRLAAEGDKNDSIGEDGRGLVMFGLPRLENLPCRGFSDGIRVSRHQVKRHHDFMPLTIE